VVDFAQKMIRWQRRYGRHGLPWQRTRDPYCIWLSEIMLQQTQVAAVAPYYERFLSRFPDVGALAAATEDEVLRLWSGLGYYARGRNLRNAARSISRRRSFPDTLQGLQALPGVGRSTAAAIAIFAFGQRAAILDGNVKRVLARRFGIEGEQAQWELAEKLLPARSIEVYTQALMDLGATICTRARPVCGRCPVARDCVALAEDRIAQLPSPRKRRPLPMRRATWLVLQHQGAVLLERRPSPGIWGGLWVFPEGPSEGLKSFCRKNFSVEVSRVQKMPVIEHGFTHFRLDILPIRCSVRRKFPDKKKTSRLWLDVAHASGAAVPAPVKALLSGLSVHLGRDQALKGFEAR
jgi:A/G-specific adenine glycosylase